MWRRGALHCMTCVCVCIGLWALTRCVSVSDIGKRCQCEQLIEYSVCCSNWASLFAKGWRPLVTLTIFNFFSFLLLAYRFFLFHFHLYRYVCVLCMLSKQQQKSRIQKKSSGYLSIFFYFRKCCFRSHCWMSHRIAEIPCIQPWF